MPLTNLKCLQKGMYQTRTKFENLKKILWKKKEVKSLFREATIALKSKKFNFWNYQRRNSLSLSLIRSKKKNFKKIKNCLKKILFFKFNSGKILVSVKQKKKFFFYFFFLRIFVKYFLETQKKKFYFLLIAGV